MSNLILYYWPPCPTCAIATRYAGEHGIELDLRDVEQEAPYNELLALGGDANK
ncbi:MAG: glutaredoxin, partial [Coriobacteriaceae bacterium]|nr:glutaredoxin [Coriobacteriaceae bacterium]